MKIYSLKYKQIIKKDINEVFTFFSNPENLKKITPKKLDFKILTPRPIKMKEGLRYLDLSSISIDGKDRVWLGSNSPKGCLQVYDPAFGLVNYFEDILLSSIGKIVIGDNISFAIYQGSVSGDIGILKFNFDEEGLPIYQDYYNINEDDQMRIGVPRHELKWMRQIIRQQANLSDKYQKKPYVLVISRPLSNFLPLERKKKILL